MLITEWKRSQTSSLSSPAVVTYIEQARLEEDAFQLLLNRIRVDVQSYIAWLKTCADFATATYFKEKQFYMDRFNHATAIAID